MELRLHNTTTKNTRAIGARVRVPAEEGDRVWVGEMRAGNGCRSSGPGSLHIGLGDGDDVDVIEFGWADSDELERYAVESVDTTVEIERDS